MSATIAPVTPAVRFGAQAFANTLAYDSPSSPPESPPRPTRGALRVYREDRAGRRGRTCSRFLG